MTKNQKQDKPNQDELKQEFDGVLKKMLSTPPPKQEPRKGAEKQKK